MTRLAIRGVPAQPVLLAGLCVVLLLVVYVGLAGNVRGTDQYWYLADAETLVRDHSIRTNNVFPAGLLGVDSALPPPFVHNILSVWLAAVPTFAIGPLWGWLLLNLVSTAATAFLVWHTARPVASPAAAGLSAAAYPLLPIVFWETAQPLSEPSTAFFSALALFAVSRAGARMAGWLLVTAALGGLYLSRESFLPLLLLVPPAFLAIRTTEAGEGWRSSLLPTLLLALAAALVLLIGRSFFTEFNVDMSYTRILHAVVPGQSNNTFFLFNLSPENLENRLPFSIEPLLLKIPYNLGAQFLYFENPLEAFFYWSFNILVVLTLLALVKRWHEPRVRLLLLAALAPVAVHGILILIYQNQFRYLLPAFPGLLVGLAIAIDSFRPAAVFVQRRVGSLMLGLALVTIPVDVALAHIVHSQSLADRRAREEIERLLEARVARDERLLVAFESGYQMVAYAARPRLVLFVHQDYPSEVQARLREEFRADVLFAPEASPAAANLDATPAPDATPIMVRGKPWRLWLLPEAGEDPVPTAAAEFAQPRQPR